MTFGSHFRSYSRRGPLFAAILFLCSCARTHGETRPVPVLGRYENATELVATADSLASARRFTEAANAYADVLRLWPDSLEVASRALGTFWLAARYDDAYIWGRRVLAREPDSLDVLFDVGVTCGFLVQVDCVDSIFQRAVQLDPRFVDGHGELGFLALAAINARR